MKSTRIRRRRQGDTDTRLLHPPPPPSSAFANNEGEALAAPSRPGRALRPQHELPKRPEAVDRHRLENDPVRPRSDEALVLAAVLPSEEDNSWARGGRVAVQGVDAGERGQAVELAAALRDGGRAVVVMA